MPSSPNTNSSRLNTVVFTRLKAIWKPRICPTIHQPSMPGNKTHIQKYYPKTSTHSPSHQSLFVKSISPYNNRSTKPTQILAQRGWGEEGWEGERKMAGPNQPSVYPDRRRNQKQSTNEGLKLNLLMRFTAAHLIKSYVCREDLRQREAGNSRRLSRILPSEMKENKKRWDSLMFLLLLHISLSLLISWKMEKSAGNIQCVRGKKGTLR